MKYQYYLDEPPFNVCDIDIQSVSRPKGYKHAFRNGRTKHGFIYTVKGEMRYTLSTGERVTLSAMTGELLFIPKGTVYSSEYSEDDTQIKVIQFDLLSGALPDYLSSVVKLTIPEARELTEAFFRPAKSHTATHPFYYLSCLYGLLWHIDESCSKIPTKYKKLSPALTEITEAFEKNEPVLYYAELCGMSEVNFRRLFKEYTGKSPIDYRNDLRLLNAKNKLMSGEYNVSEAAEACGFSNLSFFIRLYKKKYGYTPKKE